MIRRRNTIHVYLKLEEQLVIAAELVQSISHLTTKTEVAGPYERTARKSFN